MKRLISFFTAIYIAFSSPLCAQNLQQYFDGADTVFDPEAWTSSLIINVEEDTSNVWQVGAPQKVYFNTASTSPNALITDTVNYYPINNTSRFSFSVKPWDNYGIMAIRWVQKLDIDSAGDGGTIEFSVDGGMSWENVFNSPMVYNFYGFNPENVDTLSDGMIAFSGTDTAWKDIWLCFDLSWASLMDSISLRYTFVSDSISGEREGWMIDNMLAHYTYVHTIKNAKKPSYFNVYPNPAYDVIHIETEKMAAFHILEEVTLLDLTGRRHAKWHNVPTRFFIDVSKYQDGAYFLKLKTNFKTETLPVIIKH